MKNKEKVSFSIRKKVYVFLIITVSLLSCNNRKEVSPDYYKNLYTGELYTKEEMQDFTPVELADFMSEHAVKESFKVTLHMHAVEQLGDTMIQPFKYDLIIDNEYIVRAKAHEKIGMELSPRFFPDIDGDTIQVGGKQSMPTLINLWFVECRGCVAEMPALNRLYEKYGGKVNFVAMTFEDERIVRKFLSKQEFNFKHITNVESDYLKYIGTQPYPESIFLDKKGCIKYIEGPLSQTGDLDSEISYFEYILNKLLE